MNLVDLGIILVVAILVLIGFRSTKKHMKGQGGCCGGGDEIIEPDKSLEEPILGKIEIKIEGMTCQNCANRIKRALNRKNGISAQVLLRKKKAVVQYSVPINLEELEYTIENLGYQVKK